MFEISTI